MNSPLQSPSHVLGIPLIDDDHLRVELMLADAGAAADGDMPTHLAALDKELAAHFDREEALMRATDFPGLTCHMAQHNALMHELRRGYALAERHKHTALRRHLRVIVPQLVLSHITTMDRMTAAFLKGELTQETFTPLRLPVDGVPA